MILFAVAPKTATHDDFPDRADGVREIGEGRFGQDGPCSTWWGQSRRLHRGHHALHQAPRPVAAKSVLPPLREPWAVPLLLGFAPAQHGEQNGRQLTTAVHKVPASMTSSSKPTSSSSMTCSTGSDSDRALRNVCMRSSTG